MKTDLFDYPLPERLIAQVPIARRDESRLLVVDRVTKKIAHRRFREIGEYLRAGDTLFRNNAAVIPARLHAQRPTGGAVECLLLRPAVGGRGGGALSAERGAPSGGGTRSAERGTPDQTEALAAEGGAPDSFSTQHSALSAQPSSSGAQPSALRAQPASTGVPPVDAWWCLLRPGKKLPVGATFAHDDDFTGRVLERTDDGLFLVRFATREGDILAVANRLGDMPLPPYIAERDNDASRRIDRERYQTVYADRAHQVAAAAPTAGLHFTPELLDRLSAAGIRFADLTLHVGLGTFRPIATEHVEDHPIHREVYEIPGATQEALAQPTGRRIAIGTTAVRSIEDYLAKQAAANASSLSVEALAKAEGRLPPPQNTPLQPSVIQSFSPSHLAEASIFIYPPREFRGVDALITNFHQPRSTLLCLVAAFLAPSSTDGIDWLKAIYAEAVREEYRFFSYGDAMLIL